MITPMQKLSIMCLASDSENTLTELRELGVLHVTPGEESTGTTAELSHKKIEEAKIALSTIECEEHHHHNHCSADSSEDINKVISELCELHEKQRHQSEHLTNLQHLHHSILPYGDFNPESIENLSERGIVVKLYHTRDIENIELDTEHSITETGNQVASILVCTCFFPE